MIMSEGQIPAHLPYGTKDVCFFFICVDRIFIYYISRVIQ